MPHSFLYIIITGSSVIAPLDDKKFPDIKNAADLASYWNTGL